MLKTRVLTALMLLPAFLAAILWCPPPLWSVVCVVLAAVAGWEWGRLAGLGGVLRQIYPGLTALLVGIFIALSPGIPALLGMLIAATFFWCILAPLWLRQKWQLRSAGNLNILLGWALIVPATMVLAIFRGNGWSLLAILAIAWVADSAAYFSGKAFGRRKLAPQISPGKSWEGVWGASLAVSIYISIIPNKVLLFGFLPWAQGQGAQLVIWIGVALLLLAVSIVGDLLESLFKRQAGIKDSSNLLPGHGGILDRVDSLLALLPVAATVQLLSLLLTYTH